MTRKILRQRLSQAKRAWYEKPAVQPKWVKKPSAPGKLYDCVLVTILAILVAAYFV